MGDLQRWGVGLAVAVLPLLLCAAWLTPLASVDRSSGDPSVGSSGVPQLTQGSDVVVVGNSLSEFGVDTALLANRLGLKQEADLVWKPGAAAPTWYAALKNGVFAHGERPALIVVVNTMHMMLSIEAPEDRQLADLRSLLSESEPVIASKVFHSTQFDTPFARAMARRSEPRDVYIDGFKRVPFLLADVDPLREANSALDEVFGGQNIAKATDRRRMIPIVEMRDEIRTDIVPAHVAPEDSLLPDLIDLVQSHGAKIVFARVPIPRSGRQYWPLTSVVEDREVVTLLNERGAGYIDLHELPLPESAFVDDHHLGRSGQVAYTEGLAQALLEIGALEDGPMASAAMPDTFVATRRTGASPELVHEAPQIDGCDVFIPVGEPYLGLSDSRLEYLGLGSVSPLVATQGRTPMRPALFQSDQRDCSGTSFHQMRGLQIDAVSASKPEDWTVSLSENVPQVGKSKTWWVYPGTTLEFDFPASQVGDSLVGVVALQTTRSPGRPVLIVAGTRIPMKKFGLRWVGISDTLDLDRDWTLSIASPEDGPFLVTTMIAVRNGPDASFVVGGPDDMMNTLRFLGSRTVQGHPARRVVDIPHGVPVVEAGAYPLMELEVNDAVSAESLMRWAEMRHVGVDVPSRRVMGRCSPIEVTEDGNPLVGVESRDFLRGPNSLGKYSSFENMAVFRPSDGRPADHVYAARLSPRRWCRNHLYWLYPGDRVTLSLLETGRLHAGASKIELGAFVFGDPEAQIGLQFLAGNRVVLDTEVRAGDLDGGALSLPFSENVAPATRNLRLQWTVPDDGPFLLVNFGLLAP
jgi:hypothetical protein